MDTNVCSFCGEPVAMMPALVCGPQRDGDECPCCGLSYTEEDSTDELIERD
jgi:hypothetical protein